MPDRRTPVDPILAEMGFTHRRARAAARLALEEAGIAARSEALMAADEAERARQLLSDQFALVCDACHRQQLGNSDKQRVPSATPAGCQVCGGSDNRRAAVAAVKALRAADWNHVVVVGGAPHTRRELQELIGDAIQLRLIDGTHRRTQASAADDLAWADLVVIWSSTQLDHRVSNLYTAHRDIRVILVARRGAAAILEAIAQAARNTASGQTAKPHRTRKG